MDTVELIKEVEELTGMRLEHQVLLRYEREGLVSGITRGSGGRGVGRWVEYSPQALFQASVAVQMIHGTWADSAGKLNIRYKFEKNVVRIVREQAIIEFQEKSIEEREKIRRIFAGQFGGTLEIFMTAAVDIYSLLSVQANMRFCAKKNIEVPVF